MSALRISVKGQPTRIVVLNDGAVAESSRVSGEMIVAESQRSRDLRLQREASRKARAS